MTWMLRYARLYQVLELTHLQAGAQKKIVFGPAGWLRKLRNLATSAIRIL